MELSNAGEHNKRVEFCRRILEMLEWSFYDASNFDIAPKNIQNLLNDAEFVKKLNVGLEQYLGLQGVH